jgi:hypothetical protein
MNCNVAYQFCMLLFSVRTQNLQVVIIIKCYIHRVPDFRRVSGAHVYRYNFSFDWTGTLMDIDIYRRIG